MNQRLQQTMATFFALALTTSSASAATVKFTLDYDSNTSMFDVFAEVLGSDNFGLSRYGVLLDGTITSLDHESPNLTFANGPNGAGPAGWTLFRSGDAGNIIITATQDTVAPTPNIIKGFGQTAGSFAALGITPLTPTSDPVSWDARLLIASGAYSGARPSFITGSVETFAGVFSSAEGNGTMQATMEFMVVPEPAALTLAIMMVIGVTSVITAKRRYSKAINQTPQYS